MAAVGMRRRRGIQVAIDACPVGHVVRLSSGVFTVNDHVRIGKGVTLRGAGRGVTSLQKTNHGAEQEQIVVVGPSRWPHVDERTAVNLAADAVQGAGRSRCLMAPGLPRGSS